MIKVLVTVLSLAALSGCAQFKDMTFSCVTPLGVISGRGKLIYGGSILILSDDEKTVAIPVGDCVGVQQK